LKLDLSGIKLSLRQWSRFTRSDREVLLIMPCGSRAEVEAYRAELVDLVTSRAGEAAKPLAEPACRRWEDPYRIPIVVADYAASLDLSPPSRSQWAALTRLQRFVLVKLCRDNHDNINFAPAMTEFGLGASSQGAERAQRSPVRDLAARRAPRSKASIAAGVDA
jgi:hypothetical protein